MIYKSAFERLKGVKKGFGKSLILLIDTFTEKELQETQSQITDLNELDYNFDFRIINSLFDESLKTQLCLYLNRNPSFRHENLWICNFVKFYNELITISEQTNRDSVATLFAEIASELQFADCVYEWIKQTNFLIKHKYIFKLKTTQTSQIVINKEWVLNFVE